MSPEHPQARVRPAHADDLPALRRIEEEAFSTDRLSRRSFRRFLDTPSAALLVVESDGAVAAYALALFRPSAEVARLYSLAVARAAAGRGLGQALLAACEDAALRRGRTRMRLEVSATNQRALDLYCRSGFRPIADLPGYYADGGDAIRLEKALTAVPPSGACAIDPP